MECKEVQMNLDRYLEHALPVSAAQAVEEHLHQCDACWSEFTASQELHLLLNERATSQMILDEPAPLPADFTERVMAQVAAERPNGISLVWPWLRRRWSGRQYASVAYAMSATLVVVSAGNLLYLWTQSSIMLSLWGTRIEAYWQAAQAYVGVPAAYAESLWQGLVALLNLG